MRRILIFVLLSGCSGGYEYLDDTSFDVATEEQSSTADIEGDTATTVDGSGTATASNPETSGTGIQTSTEDHEDDESTSTITETPDESDESTTTSDAESSSDVDTSECINGYPPACKVWADRYQQNKDENCRDVPGVTEGNFCAWYVCVLSPLYHVEEWSCIAQGCGQEDPRDYGRAMTERMIECFQSERCAEDIQTCEDMWLKPLDE